jgi:tRNA-modifying protein YgfZ
MKKSPLFAAHQTRRADMQPSGDWLVPTHYGDVQAEIAALQSGVGITDLSHVAVLGLRGDDVVRWSHGMFTNHIKNLVPGGGNRNCMCDDRGRVQGLADVYQVDATGLILVLEGVDAAWFQKRYEMFLVLDDIEPTPFEDGGPTLLTVQGPGAAALLATLALPVPESDHAHIAVPGTADTDLRVMRKNRGGDGFDLLVPAAAIDTLWEAALAAGAIPVGTAALDARRISLGWAAWPEDGTDKSMVHELNLSVETCSFSKGCYVGQEVINRIDIKGGLQKRLVGLELSEDALPPIGAEVLLAGDVVGTISSAARADGKALALGVLRKSAWDPGSALVVRAGEREVAAVVRDLSPAEPS